MQLIDQLNSYFFNMLAYQFGCAPSDFAGASCDTSEEPLQAVLNFRYGAIYANCQVMHQFDNRVQLAACYCIF